MENKKISRIETTSLEEWKQALDLLFNKGYRWVSSSKLDYHSEHFINESARVLYFYATSPNNKIIMRGGAVDPYKLGNDVTDNCLQ